MLLIELHIIGRFAWSNGYYHTQTRVDVVVRRVRRAGGVA